MTVKKFTRKELEGRNTNQDSVFVINNIVYDVTKFLDEHPGGHEVLVNMAGQDASEAFDDVGHSLDAKDLMKKFVIGEVVDEDILEVKEKKVTWQTSETEQDTSFMSSWKFPVVLGLLVTFAYSYFFS